MKEMMWLTMNPLKKLTICKLVIDRVGFKDVEIALVTLRQIPIDVTPLIQSIQTIQKEIGSWRAQESHQFAID
jgi:hypothetical protein